MSAVVTLAAQVQCAWAGAGDLTYVGCSGNTAGCSSTSPAHALDGAFGVVISADQRQLYVAAFPGPGADGAIAHFTLDGAGNPTFQDCIGDFPGCTPTSPAGALDGATTLVLRGSNLYAADHGGRNVSHLTLDGAGNLSFDGCIGDLSGCTSTSPLTALDFAQGIALNPQGNQLYAASDNNDVAHFSVDGAGNPTFVNCYGDLAGCAPTTPAGALDSAQQVTISPNGASLYASSWANNQGDISHFAIDGSGNLGYEGCIGPLSGCTAVSPSAALQTPFGLALSPNGSRLYSAAFAGSALAELSVDSAGNLTFLGCAGAPSGCTPTNPPTALSQALGLAVSPDGRQLYLASLGTSAGGIAHFTLDGAGNASFANCIGPLIGCTAVNPSSALVNSRQLAVAPDGVQLYDTASNVSASSGTLSHLTITPPPSNAFSFGRVTLNKRRGTATLTVLVPGPGVIALGGKGIRPLRARRIALSRPVGPPWAVNVLVRLRGAAARKLRRRHRRKVAALVTYTPTDGNPNTQFKRIKLIRR